MNDTRISTDYLFEVSWEVCNKIGGIHTVVSTKAKSLVDRLNDKYITIGPDVWKETHGNPEFVEDKYLFRAWRKQANKNGLYFRVGRWNVPGQPVAVLVDFTPLFAEKNKIFGNLWEKFGLNSLDAQWDFTEPVMFGYAAGQIIESFYNFHLSEYDRIVAHFHDWMTASGILYLSEKVSQVGTLFTTHGTTLARAMANKGMPLNLDDKELNPGSIAHDLGIVARHELEALGAKKADAFTTVSQPTANECKVFLGKGVDLLTPNGFESTFVPEGPEFAEKRSTARNQLIKVAQGLLNQPIPQNAFLVGISGRYEMKNKGIDLFIDALGKLNNNDKLNNTVVAFITVPAAQTGARPEVIKRIENPDFSNPVSHEFVSHLLVDESSDEILKRIASAKLTNSPSDKVKVVFVPSYLTGNDGVVNLGYFDALIGLDLTAYPSYYEPWGYTPMESLAFRVPTITTSLTGFGDWVKTNFPKIGKAVGIIERTNGNNQVYASKMTELMLKTFSGKDAGVLTDKADNYNALVHKNQLDSRNEASKIAAKALWNSQIENYFGAFNIISEKVIGRSDQFKGKKQPVSNVTAAIKTAQPKWMQLVVEVKVPDQLGHLHKIAKNLWWTWNYHAEEMFASINPELWQKSQKNPNLLLDLLSVEDYERVLDNKEFMANYKKVVADFEAYMKKGQSKTSPKIAYFSMEYGLHTSVKIYSGGLGVLAGDYLKQASDDNVDMIGIGMLYRYGYFSQSLSSSGEQLAAYHAHDFSHMAAVPALGKDGVQLEITIAFPGRNLYAKVWKIDVGRVPLYLFDTDLKKNATYDRSISHQLYGGDTENRFKQESLLGIGGIRLLDALGIKPDIYHLNEGHAAFAGLERLRVLVQDEKISFKEAVEVVRSSSLFTTHTPVPAGHDKFSEDMLRTYMPHYAERLGISWETFIALGRIDPGQTDEKYSMSILATKLSQEVNGVSKLHGAVSRDMFKDLYPGYYAEELHIGHVTNGVHYGTWTSKEWQQLFSKTFGEGFTDNVSDGKVWEKIYDVDDEQIWDLRNQHRANLIKYLKGRILSNLSGRTQNPRNIYQTIEGLDENALIIGFARRFATYKRAKLLFNDVERLAQIVNKAGMPVQFIYAGKAHPADKYGQDLIKGIVEISKRPEFKGKIFFIEDYDMELGAELTRGVDIWLNTPTRPLEASGTSGMKAVLNGAMNFSVLDGWWLEGYKPEAGWAIKEEATYDNEEFQNELDAETIYSTLENEIMPMFYERNQMGIPTQWITWIKNNLVKIAPYYANKRMLDDYFEKFYNKLAKTAKTYSENNYEKAIEKRRWKEYIARNWEKVEVDSIRLNGFEENSLPLGDIFTAEVVLDPGAIDPKDIGVEVVFARQSFTEETKEVITVYEMDRIKVDREEMLVTYRCEVKSRNAGNYNYAFRIFPKNEHLAHRQDLPLIKWA